MPRIVIPIAQEGTVSVSGHLITDFIGLSGNISTNVRNYQFYAVIFKYYTLRAII